jgi:hypothetical protein
MNFQPGVVLELQRGADISSFSAVYLCYPQSTIALNGELGRSSEDVGHINNLQSYGASSTYLFVNKNTNDTIVLGGDTVVQPYEHGAGTLASSNLHIIANKNNSTINIEHLVGEDANSWLTFQSAADDLYEKDSEVVGNCHKQPDRLFTRRLLDVDTICGEWNDTLREAKQRFPGLKVMLSVSPIRHLKDGLHGNQISKSVLLLAIDRLCRELDFCHYFPSYEIVMDELRDYRLYAEDMLHPSPLAVKYIWECFCSTYMSKDTQRVMKEWVDIQKGLAHRPFNPDSDAYRRFLSQIVLKIEELKEKFPYFEVQKELEQCRTLLNT